jgi:hypothetical protein
MATYYLPIFNQLQNSIIVYTMVIPREVRNLPACFFKKLSCAFLIVNLMKWLFLILLISTFGCKRQVETLCGTLKCPIEEKTVSISTVDAFHKPLKAAYIESFNYRTGVRHTNLQGWPHLVNAVSYKYRVFDNPRAFSATGDAVSLTIRSESGKESTTYHKIAGGQCACDVIRISGLDVIQID